MTGQPARNRLPAMDLAVDVGFGILLLVSAGRYFTRHPLDGEGVAVLLLAIGSGVSYAIAVMGLDAEHTRSDRVATRQSVGVLVATAFWVPLTIIAPSFAWCAFALFFAVHRVLRGAIAYVVSSIVVVAVSVGLLLVSSGSDPGLVLGPFFGGLVLSAAYAALDRAISSQQHLIAELLTTREQLARSERDAGALTERNRVAGELHDTVVQRTASALLLLEADDQRPGGSSANVAEAREALRDALVETRRLLHGMVDADPMTESLEAMLARQATAAGAGFTTDGVTRPVDPTVAQALQRVTQEALINAHKHAGAENVRVTLTYFPDAVGVDIADDGRGIPEPADGTEDDASDGFGIRAMTWRVQSLGGALTIESRPGGGTVVAARVPASPGEATG